MTQFTTDHPTDVLNTVLYITQYLCIVFVTLFVLMRLAIRTYYKQPFGVEDAACYVSYVLFMAYCAISIVLAQHGGGYHLTDITEHTGVQFKKYAYIATVIYCPMALVVKVALLFIITRVFSPFRTKVIMIYVFFGALCIYYIIAEIIKIRMCDPVPAYWLGSAVPGASCLDQQAAFLADSVISVVSDTIILVMPLPLTWSLQMSRNRKLRVMGILSAGGLATAFSLYRLVLVVKDGSSADQTIFFTCVLLSGNAEGGVGLICACLPSVNLVISKLRKFSSANRSYGKNDSSSVPLSKLRMGGSKGQQSKTGMSKDDPEATITDYGNDETHLISFAGAPGNGVGAIHKTVDVSQTVESVGSQNTSSRSQGNQGVHYSSSP